MATESRLMTADELLRLPRGRAWHELVRGELRTMAPSGFEHGDVTSIFDGSLGSHVRAHRLGRVLAGDPGFLLTTQPDTVRVPTWPSCAASGFKILDPCAATGWERRTWRSRSSPRTTCTPKSTRRSPSGWSRARGWSSSSIPAAIRWPSTDPASPCAPSARGEVLDAEDIVPGWALPVREVFADA